MKKIGVNFLFLFLFFNTHAQWVQIPDTNFVSWLNNHGYSSCMSGNLMDTSCSKILTTTRIDMRGDTIHSLVGIEYFDNLRTLICSRVCLYYFQSLPPSLDTFVCNNNNLTGHFPKIPKSLIYLNCSYNTIDLLPPLHNSLTYLNCDYNELSSLPTLPKKLKYLSCSGGPYMDIKSFPPLPDSLLYFNCSENFYSTLPTLPQTLQHFDCSNMYQLSNFPDSLPKFLKYFDCWGDYLDSLPQLPNTIDTLNCGGNNLKSIPNLPSSLIYLQCNANWMHSLPSSSFPNSLKFIDCSQNSLNYLPELPDSLINLYCYNNSLGYIPAVPNTLKNLFCFMNFPLTCLPILPDTMESLEFYGTSVECIPNAPFIKYTYSSQYYFDISLEQICKLNNKNGCPVRATNNTNEIDNKKVTIFPNPCSDYLNVNSSNIQISSFKIYNLLDELVVAVEKRDHIDTGNIPAGIYILRIETPEGVFYKNQVIQH